MKTRLHKYFGVTMTLLILVSSMGFRLVKHHCQLRGSSVYVALLKPESCGNCHKKNTKKQGTSASFERSDCCDEVSVLHSVDISAIHKTTLTKTWTLDGTYTNTFYFDFLGATISKPIFFTSKYAFDSLFYGRRLLAFVQSFLI
jgi:hypothetical protein